MENIQRDEDIYIIFGNIDKLNILRAFYEKVNSPRHLNTETRLREMIDKKLTKFKN